ncbi:hypothetical protein [Mycolicibacterium helvum]|nr:hypothetical protein [Mycolicibacterium helvum]
MYPEDLRVDVGIVIASRSGERTSDFALSVLSYSAIKRDWKMRHVSMPERSSALAIAGTGANTVRASLELWDANETSGTSRAVFSAFCEALEGGEDPSSGGPPQLVGLHRIGSGKTFGVVFGGQRFLSGADVHTQESKEAGAFEWFNNLFELTDPLNKKRRAGAQVHKPRPGA